VSEEAGFGVKVAERFFGLIVLVVGILSTYWTYSTAPALGAYTAFFGVVDVAVMVLGFVMLTAKTE